MPILPENRHRYPANWQEIRRQVRARSGDRCEQCDVPNGAIRLTYRDQSEEVTRDLLLIETATTCDGARAARIVLTVAHLDHTPEHNALENLKHLCQRCHNRHDAGHRAHTRRRKLRNRTLDFVSCE